MIELEVKSDTCNICKLKFSGGEEACPGHFQILPYLHNANPEYKEYQQFLINKNRQQQRLPAIEFQPRSKKFSGE